MAFLLFLFLGSSISAFAQPCDPLTPSDTVDLSSNEDSVWVSDPLIRYGHCCSSTGSDRCVEFIVYLAPGANGIRFDIISGAIPPGALFYEIGCANPTQVGDTLCLDGEGPHRITFCKPGNNTNVYQITSIASPDASPPITVSDGCSGQISVTDLTESTIVWTPLPALPQYYSYMSCSSGCDTVDIQVTGTSYPPFIDFAVQGYPKNMGCDTSAFKDTVRVYFVSDKLVEIQPEDPTVCFGGSFTTITANPSGGAPPYTYNWSTGESTQSIDVGVGTYWVEVSDTTNCPPVYDTVIVTAHLSPISANAGSDVSSCTNAPSATVTGTVNVATGGIWSGGNGTYSPSNTDLTMTYTPTPAEISAGSVELILTTTGNGGCPPETDTVMITIEPAPTVDAGTNQTVCADIASVNISGSFSNAGGVSWSTSGTGTFGNSSNPSTTYNPTDADTAAGTVTLTLTTTNTGACAVISDIMTITFTPAPTVNAGNDLTVCGDVSSVALSGIVITASGGSWSTSGTGTFSPNNTTLTADYIPSSLDTLNGSVTLTLTTTGNGTCNTYTDDVVISFTDAPIVDAGPDITICADAVSIPLSPSVQNTSGYTWSTSGSGSFSPDINTLLSSYTPSVIDTSNGSVTLTLEVTGNPGCSTYTDDLTLTLTNAPTVSAGTNITTCKDVTSIPLNGVITTASGATWTTSGTGTFNPSASSLNAAYEPSTSDTTAGSVTLTLTTNGNGTCSTYQDQIDITFTDIPTVSAGGNQTICADETGAILNGSVSVASGGIWSSTGSGTFNPSNTSLGATYIPSDADTAAGSVSLTLTTTGNGQCQAYNDIAVITISPTPYALAGSDQVICGDAVGALLSGQVVHASGGQWTTSGSGSFSPNDQDLSASYIPSDADTLSGNVTLTLTTTGNGQCQAYSDDLNITISNVPVVDAGTDITTCKDISSVSLSGSIWTASGGTWSTSGSGSFSPSANALNATYIPSTADTTLGSVTITLTSTGNGSCSTYTDDLVINFTDIPTVYAGPDQVICADENNVALIGSVTTATGGTWTTNGTGNFSPDANTLGAIYMPSPSDTTIGSVALTLTTTGNGQCQAYNDVMSITIDPAPIVEAGSDQIVCADISSVSLSGGVSHATGGIWTTSGSGTFSPNSTDLNASYIPTSADTALGAVTLFLETTGNGGCNSKTDSLIITFTNAPTVAVVNDIDICKDVVSIPVSGVITTATGGIWTSSGSGTFNPNNATLSPNYIPSSADTSAGSVILTLTTTGNGTCNAYSDNLTINFIDLPIVNAGIDQTVCADIQQVSLSGAVTNATGGIWTTNGTGSFSPSNVNLASNYITSLGDTSVGSVTLTLTSTGNGTCQAYSDQMTITITPAPVAFAGNDTAVCITNAIVPLNGDVYTAAGGVWSSSGSGTFTPNSTDLNASYVTSPADQAAGSVEIYLTTIGNGLCNSVTDTMLLSITPSTIVVNAGTDTLVCGDDSLSLFGTVQTATGGVWNTLGDGSFSDTNDLNASYYFGPADTVNESVVLFLTSTGNGGCAAQVDSFLVNIQDPLWLTTSVLDTSCANGGEFIVSGVSSTGSGVWSTLGDGTFSPSGNILSPSYLPGNGDTTTGYVSLIFTTTNNGVCAALSDTNLVELIDEPSVSFSMTSPCVNEIITLTSNSSAIGGITNWEWQLGGNSFSSSSSVNQSFITEGNYSIELVLTSGYGCLDSLEQTITVHPLPQGLIESSANCYIDSVYLFDQSSITSGLITSWEWSFENGSTSTNSSFATTVDSAGFYSIGLIVTSDHGCTDTVVDTLQVIPNPVALFDFDSACLNSSNNFMDQSTVEFGTLVSWNWTFETNEDSIQNPQYTFSSDGSHNVMLIVTSSHGCVDTLEQSIVVHPNPNAAFSYEGFCEEDDVEFTDETTINSGAITNWSWTFNGGDASTLQNPNYNFGSTGTYPVNLIVSSDYGCSDTVLQMISISPNPTAEFSWWPEVPQVLDDLWFLDESIDANTWDWDFGDTLGFESGWNPVYNYQSYGTFPVALVITNSFGCTDTIVHDVTVKQPPLLPSGFSPNGDGLNDVFHVLGGTFIEFDFQIYNNWGKMIFQTDDPSEGWDGTHLGVDQPIGTYVYLVRVVTQDEVEYKLHGDVTVIR